MEVLRFAKVSTKRPTCLFARLLSTFVKPKWFSVEYQVLFYAFAFPSMECISVPPAPGF